MSLGFIPILVRAIYSFPIKLEAFIWSSKVLNTIFFISLFKKPFLHVLSIIIIYLTNVFLITQLLYYLVSTYKCLKSEICLGKKLFYLMYNVISSQIIIEGMGEKRIWARKLWCIIVELLCLTKIRYNDEVRQDWLEFLAGSLFAVKCDCASTRVLGFMCVHEYICASCSKRKCLFHEVVSFCIQVQGAEDGMSVYVAWMPSYPNHWNISLLDFITVPVTTTC